MALPSVIRLHPEDAVLIARGSLPSGTVVADGVTTVERIPAGHKVAIRSIAPGEPITCQGIERHFGDRRHIFLRQGDFHRMGWRF